VPQLQTGCASGHEPDHEILSRRLQALIFPVEMADSDRGFCTACGGHENAVPMKSIEGQAARG